jgi:hypothetical protein
MEYKHPSIPAYICCARTSCKLDVAVLVRLCKNIACLVRSWQHSGLRLGGR